MNGSKVQVFKNVKVAEATRSGAGFAGGKYVPPVWELQPDYEATFVGISTHGEGDSDGLEMYPVAVVRNGKNLESVPIDWIEFLE